MIVPYVLSVSDKYYMTCVCRDLYVMFVFTAVYYCGK